jgi:hypothetical protein
MILSAYKERIGTMTYDEIYTDQQFGKELLTELDRGYDPIRISKWADSIFFSTRVCDSSSAVKNALIDLFTMQEGEEFFLPESDLRKRAQEFLAS